MKILLVTEDILILHLGGAGKHAVLLGNALTEAGHQVELLGCLRSAGVKTNNGFLGKLHAGIDLSRTGLKGFALGVFNPARRLLMAWQVWKAIQRLEDIREGFPEILDVYSAPSTSAVVKN